MMRQEQIDNCYAAREQKQLGECKGCYKLIPLTVNCTGCQFTNEKTPDLCEECKVCQKCKDAIRTEIYKTLNSPFNTRNPPSRNALQQMADYHDTGIPIVCASCLTFGADVKRTCIMCAEEWTCSQQECRTLSYTHLTLPTKRIV